METKTPVEILHADGVPWEDADRNTFTGRARIKRMGGAGASPGVKAYRVAFDPGARTHWHVHSGPQLLLVVEGECLVQRWGGPVEVAHAGDLVHIPADVKHWHGAGKGVHTTHVAVNVDAETTWMEAAPAD